MAITAAHKAYLAIRTAAGIYADHCNPFGLSSAAGILGEAVDAAMDLLVATFHAAFFKWVDDIISTRTPLQTAAGGQYVYDFDIQDVVGVLEFLGFKIAHPKVTTFAYMCTYNGLLGMWQTRKSPSQIQSVLSTFVASRWPSLQRHVYHSRRRRS